MDKIKSQSLHWFFSFNHPFFLKNQSLRISNSSKFLTFFKIIISLSSLCILIKLAETGITISRPIGIQTSRFNFVEIKLCKLETKEAVTKWTPVVCFTNREGNVYNVYKREQKCNNGGHPFGRTVLDHRFPAERAASNRVWLAIWWLAVSKQQETHSTIG